ncbi:MAG TPA: PhnD/SsuA/transferrin family substrate-binding protein [Phycisphaerae bacterium]|jgi:ABC-type phosphate/phosphonate transport system substrate-binding protein|nr:PhnD/SsuA/transferrin family substrate-binding protein [Phycisphaerae bacterium]HPC23379.1 PhnD/SsuA/transferrin family substrate-binding protein [Phycisphaerae bacterium]HRS27814.1 PhnD/SsuA/transferrin family substrate-binding protein [Phycisphaerae bacterium]HRT41809.1 PhnD/SsuA/transferrin family substrate-binding protein [Phycisphaerae bacterium]
MRPNAVRLAWLCLLGFVGIVGCESPGVRFLNFITLQKNPLVLALVAENRATNDDPLQALNPFGPYSALQHAMSRDLQRTVALDLCFPFQLQPCLETGLYHAAVVSPIQYARLSEAQRFPVIAVPAGEGEPIVQPALLVVPADSLIQAVEDLCGETVAFGPAPDSRTHYAALDLLAAHGLQKADLRLELLPIPGSLKHLPNAREVVSCVLSGGAAAGFVDEGEWQKLPETSNADGAIARDKLRVIARTAALPNQLVVASPRLDPQTLERMQSFFIHAGETHPEALQPLRIERFELPSDELLATCRELAVRESRPAAVNGGAEALSPAADSPAQ